ncbi:MAG: hypothetical protein R2712_11085 [Vicinamibacterales bacterium]
MVLVIGAGMLLEAPAAPVAAGALPGTWGADGFLLAVGAGLFAFGGWHMVTYTAGETLEADRTIPRALVIGITSRRSLRYGPTGAEHVGAGHPHGDRVHPRGGRYVRPPDRRPARWPTSSARS